MTDGITYGCDLGTGQRLWLDNQGEQTRVTLASSGAGQQQQSTQGVQTGRWVAQPEAFQTAGGIVVKLQTVSGTLFLQIQSGQIGLIDAGAVEAGFGARPILLQAVPAEVHPPAMQPMSPMQPIQMGNMSMSLNPMSMRMGNMEMRMGEPSGESSSQPFSESSMFTSPAPTAPPVPVPSVPNSPDSAAQQFCSQCGTGVKPTDRFCSSCGTRLN
jgi:zinc-ribbon domain